MNHMTLDEYQTTAQETAVYNTFFNVVYPALGLAGEAGEVADIVKKALRDGPLNGDQRAHLKSELGDVLWYVAALAGDMGWTLGDIASDNLAKLRDRAARDAIKGSGDDR